MKITLRCVYCYIPCTCMLTWWCNRFSFLSACVIVSFVIHNMKTCCMHDVCDINNYCILFLYTYIESWNCWSVIDIIICVCRITEGAWGQGGCYYGLVKFTCLHIFLYPKLHNFYYMYDIVIIFSASCDKWVWLAYVYCIYWSTIYNHGGWIRSMIMCTCTAKAVQLHMRTRVSNCVGCGSRTYSI